ncbi:MAG: M14 family metallopeptidase [Alphaproteobacteria bacterium]|nr:M14 family metallopeptidase [Alphaproteobacteria bacterium]
MRVIQTYQANRDSFCKKALQCGARLYHLPYAGSTDPDLATDIAVLGDDNAENVIVVSSGLHGVELPAGSLVQQIALDKIKDRHLKTTKFVFVHALNPYGAKYSLRTDRGEGTSRNIDPARNFLDFASPDFIATSANPAIASAFDKASLSNSSLSMMWARLLYTAFIEQGQSTFKRNFVRGQYTDPSLPYYGGDTACFTRLTWEHIVRHEILKPAAKKIYHFDCHTGDGPFGVLQLYLCAKAGKHTRQLAEKLTSPEKIKTTDDYFAQVTGDIGDYWASFDVPEGTQIYPITLEFGTTQARVSGIDVLGAILNRTLLSEKYNDDHPQKDQIIQKMCTAFTPTQKEWSDVVMNQSHDIWEKFLKLE